MDKTIMTAIGLMSGTSLDGVDAAILRSDGVRIYDKGPALTLAYPSHIQQLIRDAIAGEAHIPQVEKDITEWHVNAVNMLMREYDIGQVNLIGFHGQTIMHQPEEGLTWQLGNGALLAALTGMDVVCDFRRMDVALGGQGAPLVPVYHQALCAELPKPLAIVNIGGVANVTWIGEGEENVLAFDTGPGNALLNDWCMQHAGVPMDNNGALAATGNVDEGVLEQWMTHAYFGKTPPKSLDRDDFAEVLNTIAQYATEDGAACLTAFTAQSVAAARAHMPQSPKHWYITGGGRHNPVLMHALIDALGNVSPVEALGWNGDMLEAEAFAYLAIRSVNGLPLTFPGTTGVSHAAVGGAFYRGGSDGVHSK